MSKGGEQSPPVSCGGYYLRASNGTISNGSIPCKRWDCKNPLCGRSKLAYYYALFCNGLNVVEYGPVPNSTDVTLITVTTDYKKWDSKGEAWDRIPYCFKLFRQRIYRHYGKFEYIAVTEATKQGYPHIHIVCRGVANIPQGWHEEYLDTATGEWCKVLKQSDKDGKRYRILRYPSEDGRPTLSEMADDSGLGFVCDIRNVRFDNNKGAANYLLGYLSKSLDSEHYPRNYRRVRFTPGWPTEEWNRPKKLNGVGLIVPFEDEVMALREYVERGMSSGFMAEDIIDRLNRKGASKIARKLLRKMPLEELAKLLYDDLVEHV